MTIDVLNALSDADGNETRRTFTSRGLGTRKLETPKRSCKNLIFKKRKNATSLTTSARPDNEASSWSTSDVLMSTTKL
jgi:hypothetical protein